MVVCYRVPTTPLPHWSTPPGLLKTNMRRGIYVQGIHLGQCQLLAGKSRIKLADEYMSSKLKSYLCTN
ncbi:hypothetical protein K1T71_011675 [Dendrolimus kikuchii]|uniref:Uncharacterized protein n=1 Tax=Dendrolimus kikuchii TaxID=765133 RepID=A0ACC1CM64_9NEOP|nr:hypothetical protein K1T71_011675 [Dendrolimus kikuchii]